MSQSFEPLKAVPDVTSPFVGISVCHRGDGRTVLFLHADGRDLRVSFNQVLALQCHDEFTHPLGIANFNNCKLPNIPGGSGAYPLLIVRESRWISSFPDSRLEQGRLSPVHYLFISMSYYVDIISFMPPEVAWVGKGSVESISSIVEASGA